MLLWRGKWLAQEALKAVSQGQVTFMIGSERFVGFRKCLKCFNSPEEGQIAILCVLVNWFAGQTKAGQVTLLLFLAPAVPKMLPQFAFRLLTWFTILIYKAALFLLPLSSCDM